MLYNLNYFIITRDSKYDCLRSDSMKLCEFSTEKLLIFVPCILSLPVVYCTYSLFTTAVCAEYIICALVNILHVKLQISLILYCISTNPFVTGPAKTRHLGTNYIASLNKSFLSIATKYL